MKLTIEQLIALLQKQPCTAEVSFQVRDSDGDDRIYTGVNSMEQSDFQPDPMPHGNLEVQTFRPKTIILHVGL